MINREYVGGAGMWVRRPAALPPKFPYLRLMQLTEARPIGRAIGYEFELGVARSPQAFLEGAADPDYLEFANERITLKRNGMGLPLLTVNLAGRYETPLDPIITKALQQMAHDIGVEWYADDIDPGVERPASAIGILWADDTNEERKRFMTYDTPARYGATGPIVLEGERYVVDVPGFLAAGLRLAFAETTCMYDAEEAARELFKHQQLP